MSVQPFVLRPDQHELALNVVGTQMTVLAPNAVTQGTRNCRTRTTAQCYSDGHIWRYR
ncbi:MAG: hypothetical protein NTAFB01_04570 [Nitrospira sp.]